MLLLFLFLIVVQIGDEIVLKQY